MPVIRQGDPAATSEVAVRPAPQARVTADPSADLAVYANALWNGRVTFHDVAEAWFKGFDPSLSDIEQQAFKETFPSLLDSFAEARGGVLTAYFGRNVQIAAVLTDVARASAGPAIAQRREPGPMVREVLPGWQPPPNEKRQSAPTAAPTASAAIHIEPPFTWSGDERASKLALQCLDLHFRALEYLARQPRIICLRMILGLLRRCSRAPTSTLRGPTTTCSGRSRKSSRRPARTSNGRRSARPSWSI